MFTLPDLPYDYDALEPFIDKETMTIHHDKHHGAYVDNLNKLLEPYPQFYEKSIETILSNLDDLPADIKQGVINNGGGHANHSFFWNIMASEADSSPPSEELKDAINSTFGSIDIFKEEFTTKAMGVFGSGWAFLILTPDKKLSLKKHSFQNNPLSDDNVPILGIDVWEHAYYLKYQNRRAEYIRAWWNIVNWQEVARNYVAAMG